MRFDYDRYFERRRENCSSELVVKGTRVTVRTLLAIQAEGASASHLLTPPNPISDGRSNEYGGCFGLLS